MKILKYIIKGIIVLILIPIAYVILSLILTYIPHHSKIQYSPKNESIYLQTNGVHLSIILNKNQIAPPLLKDLKIDDNDRYFSFAWGDKNFYLNTPTWSDLTFKNSFIALFLKSPTLIHITRYQEMRTNWVEIKIDKSQLAKLNKYLYNSFYLDDAHQKVLVEHQFYADNDNFYEAKGNYTCFKTCNSWVNSAFKQSDLKSCLWTPFDFGLFQMYQK
ncbi:MAG: DUF2459 domain-containing protein [Flavobacteriaceae bacterium]|nr:DUF2459 domain-containing protein [Flavobacteriaceae bacterium]